MKKLNKFKIWLGKKLIDVGFGVLLKLDDRDWNPQKECYPGSVKQLKYVIGSWFVTRGMRLESYSLDKEKWPGYKSHTYYDHNFYIKKNIKKKKSNGHNDLDKFFRDWEE